MSPSDSKSVLPLNRRNLLHSKSSLQIKPERRPCSQQNCVTNDYDAATIYITCYEIRCNVLRDKSLCEECIYSVSLYSIATTFLFTSECVVYFITLAILNYSLDCCVVFVVDLLTKTAGCQAVSFLKCSRDSQSDKQTASKIREKH